MKGFTTKRLVMKEVQFSDLHDIHYLHTLPEVAQYNTYSLQQTISVLETWLNDQKSNQQANYVFAIKLDKVFVGLIVLSNASNPKLKLGTIWYLLLPDFWGQGIATEALKGLLKFAFEELQLHRIEAGAAIDHIASHRVLEKAGMIKEGQKRKVLPLENGWSDNFEYAILEEDWFSRKDQ